MKTETFFSIHENGELHKVSVTSTPIEMTRSIMQSFASESVVQTPGLFDATIISPNLCGLVGMSRRANQIVFSMRIRTMTILAPWVMRSGALVPAWSSSDAPVLAMQWNPPENMMLMFVVEMDGIFLRVGVQYLVAMDSSRVQYRLPTTNVYENGKICAGKYDSQGYTYADCLAKAWKQFESSPWNADLQDRGGENMIANSYEMFKFKPREKDGFTQLPIDGDWRRLCSKFGNELITANVVLT